MRRFLVTFVGVPEAVFLAVALVALASCAGAITGCAGIPETQRYAVAEAAYVAAVDAVTLAGDELSLEQLETADVYRGVADAELDAWGDDILEGRPYDGRRTLNRAIDNLIRLKLEAREE